MNVIEISAIAFFFTALLNLTSLGWWVKKMILGLSDSLFTTKKKWNWLGNKIRYFFDCAFCQTFWFLVLNFWWIGMTIRESFVVFAVSVMAFHSLKFMIHSEK